MKPIFAILLIGFSLLLALGLTKPGKSPANNLSPSSARVPVIVELFTSEGCSSCPPADALLKKIEEEQPIENVEVIALEEHVDYWNNLGWTDPFSSSDATFRQQQYADTFRNSGAYTPQMIVDGQKEFVGSRERQARTEIEQASKLPKTRISLTPKSSVANGTAQFNVQVGKLTGEGAEVWLAVTETQLHSSVKAGENAGEDLHHAAIVRRLHKIGEAKPGNELPFSSDTTVKLDAKWKPENLHVVVFVQEKKSRHILGAASTSITQ